MKIAVCVKWVADLDSVDVDPLRGGIDERRLLHVLDPGAESALTVALSLTDAPEIAVYTVGPASADPALRLALALGIENVLRIDAEPRPALTAPLLAKAIAADGPFDLVLCGARSSDRGSGEIPALLGDVLGLPVATDVNRLTRDASGFSCERELDRGAREVVQLAGASVVGLTAGMGRLPTASLPGLMSAQKASIPTRRPDVAPLASDPVVLERTELPPRPRVKPVKPPSGTPDQRLAAITQGAGGTRTRGRLLEGPPAEMADAIMTFLRERGFVGPARS